MGRLTMDPGDVVRIRSTHPRWGDSFPNAPSTGSRPKGRFKAFFFFFFALEK